MAHSVKLLPKVHKSVNELPADTRKRVFRALQDLSTTPRPTGCKKLKGRDAYRIRVGDYRVVYEIHDDVLVVLVVRVAHRSEVYRQK